MMTLTAGQSGDNPQLAPLVAHYTATGARGFRLLADKAYSHDSTRAHLRQHRVAHTIPERCDQIGRRKPRDHAADDRPPSTRRSTSTRYDKLAIVYRGAAVLRAITLWLPHLSDTP